jgi:hypothetical protein
LHKVKSIDTDVLLASLQKHDEVDEEVDCDSKEIYKMLNSHKHQEHVAKIIPWSPGQVIVDAEAAVRGLSQSLIKVMAEEDKSYTTVLMLILSLIEKREFGPMHTQIENFTQFGTYLIIIAHG